MELCAGGAVSSFAGPMANFPATLHRLFRTLAFVELSNSPHFFPSRVSNP
jgi:hypothetical protein